MDKKRILSAYEIDSILGDFKKTLDKYTMPYKNKKVDPITENVYIVSQGNYMYNELIELGARGGCRVEDGYIFIREDVELTPHLLIHEFIHRLSRNRRLYINSIEWKWVEGINLPEDCLDYMNEVITEMITVDIIGREEEGNPYTIGLELMREFANKVGMHDLADAYFYGNVRFFRKKLKRYYRAVVNSFCNLVGYYIKAYSANGTLNDKYQVCDAERNLKMIVDAI